MIRFDFIHKTGSISTKDNRILVKIPQEVMFCKHLAEGPVTMKFYDKDGIFLFSGSAAIIKQRRFNFWVDIRGEFIKHFGYAKILLGYSEVKKGEWLAREL